MVRPSAVHTRSQPVTEPAAPLTVPAITPAPVERARLTGPLPVSTDAAPSVLPEDLLVSGPAAAPLTVTTTTLPQGTVGLPYQASLTAAGGTPPYAWELTGGLLPEGLSPEISQGAVTGTPTQSGTFQLTMTVQDRVGTTATKAFTLVIRASALFLISGSFPGATVGQRYSQPLAAQGGKPPYVWSIVSGTLPDGLTLVADQGRVEGTPIQRGQQTVRIMVQDQEGQSDTAEFTVLVVPSPLKLLAVSLPPASEGTAYQAALSAEGGTPPYQWQIEAGALPTGLTLDSAGLITGTPVIEGEGSFTVHVEDVDGQSVRQLLTLRVVGPTLSPVTQFIAAPSDGKAGLAWTNPASVLLAETRIVRSTTGYPVTPADGALVYAGTGTQWVDTGLSNGTAYFYSAFALDARGRFSAPTNDSRGQAVPQPVNVSGGPADPYADVVIQAVPRRIPAFGENGMPAIVLGPPMGEGSFQQSKHVFSLGCAGNTDQGGSAPYGGSITLEFTNNIIVDRPGPDFTVFENPFFVDRKSERRYMEPAIVEVSQDGVRYHRFPFDYVPHFSASGEPDFRNPFIYSVGFAGVTPVCSHPGGRAYDPLETFCQERDPDPTNPAVSGGDSFDLSQLVGQPLRWARFVRIMGTGDGWLTDVNGDLVRHDHDPFTRSCDDHASNPEGQKSGFDLDAVAAIHY